MAGVGTVADEVEFCRWLGVEAVTIVQVCCDARVQKRKICYLCTSKSFYIAADRGPELGEDPCSELSSRGAYRSYCMQRLLTGRTQHVLFWVQDGTGASTLAAIGSDSRSSGHYTYVRAPGFAAPPLSCTNRSDVVVW
ncbi:hypothetical protein H632_c2164p0, partial [Helicosporidium sp. ATCC 50920]